MKIAKFLGIALTLPVFLGSNIRPAIASEYQLDPMVEQQIIDRLCQMVVQGYTGEAIWEEAEYWVGLNIPAPKLIQYRPGISNYEITQSLNNVTLSAEKLKRTLTTRNLMQKWDCDFYNRHRHYINRE